MERREAAHRRQRDPGGRKRRPIAPEG